MFYPALAQTRSNWESGLIPIGMTTHSGQYLVVLKDKDGLFHCHRYFCSEPDPLKPTAKWKVSVDAKGVNQAEVLKWLLDTFSINRK